MVVCTNFTDLPEMLLQRHLVSEEHTSRYQKATGSINQESGKCNCYTTEKERKDSVKDKNNIINLPGYMTTQINQEIHAL